jgi:Mrp family chromosome partitioning ATPase/capsular polysaccharide biosynthesis protein
LRDIRISLQRYEGGEERRLSENLRPELSVRDYARLLLRRKWIVIGAVVLLPAIAVTLALRQSAVYQATATVAIKEGNLAAIVSGIQDNSFYADPDRLAQTQIHLAETPAVAARVLERAGMPSGDRSALLGSTVIKADPNADILYFTVKDHDRGQAAVLANAYAKEYTVLRAELDTQSLSQARADILKRVRELEAEGRARYASSLTEKADQLVTLQELQGSNAVIAHPAEGASQISPRPKRDGLIGLALGLILGVGLAFLRDALDTRVRTAEDVAGRLGLPLLARIPEPPRKLQRAEELVLFKEPASVRAEAFRMLRTNMEFAGLDHDTRSIMITSALEKEGKSTTISNLAIVAARSGKRVVLVDLDLRRPRVDKFFKLEGQPGLTNVVLGHATLDEATARIALSGDGRPDAPAEGNGHAAVDGILDVIPTGPIPPDPGEFVATAALSRVLNSLAASYDLVLIDAPPVLHVGDALTLATKVSALLVTTRLPAMRRPILNELARVLARCPTRKLGFVLTGAHAEDDYGQGYYYYYSSERRGRGRSAPERVM